jgi:sialic acid synthase SpsE
MITIAAEAGVDAVKFQVFKAEKFLTKNIPVFLRAKSLGYKSQFDRFKDLEFRDEQIIKLYETATKEAVHFIATPFDVESVKLLTPLVSAFKIASADLINIQLLRCVADKGKPVILSTGQATIEEIDEAAKIFSIDKLYLMHCVSSYPAPENELNLESLPFMKDRYKVTIGYSDHSIGNLACISAVAMGAQIIEKHFTLDKTHQFGDHPLSADLNDMKKLVSDVRRIEEMRGVYGKKCQPSESESKKQLRRSLHINFDIKKGSVINVDMLIPLVSGEGMAANRIDDVVGKTVIRDIKKGEPVSLSVLK